MNTNTFAIDLAIKKYFYVCVCLFFAFVLSSLTTFHFSQVLGTIETLRWLFNVFTLVSRDVLQAAAD